MDNGGSSNLSRCASSFERRCDRTLVLIAARMAIGMIDPAISQPMDQSEITPEIAIELGDRGLALSKTIVKILIRPAMAMFAGSLIKSTTYGSVIGLWRLPNKQHAVHKHGLSGAIFRTGEGCSSRSQRSGGAVLEVIKQPSLRCNSCRTSDLASHQAERIAR